MSFPASRVDALAFADDAEATEGSTTSTRTSTYNSFDSDRESSRQVRRPLEIPIPNTWTGLATYGHQQAIQNRMKEIHLERKGKFDMDKHSPAFVHDILMLPGSLATLLDKVTQTRTILRMTPALLPGYKTLVHPETLLPRLVESSNPDDYVQGMVIFGLGKEGRKLISRHYNPTNKRKKVFVDIEVSVQAKSSDDAVAPEAWRLKRRVIKTWAWPSTITSPKKEELPNRFEGIPWMLEDHLARNFEPNETNALRVEPSAKGDEDADGYIGRDVQEFVIEPEKREVVYSGSGGVSYVRGTSFTGW